MDQDQTKSSYNPETEEQKEEEIHVNDESEDTISKSSDKSRKYTCKKQKVVTIITPI